MNPSHSSLPDARPMLVNKFLVPFFALVVAIGISACAPVTLEGMLASGATRLSQDQARNHVSGKTEKWVKHATYYNANGELEVLWDKATAKGTWEVSTDGMVCMNIKSWKQDCHLYVNDSGTITTIRDGKSAGVREMVEGRHVSRQ
jgi:hypothetical protein